MLLRDRLGPGSWARLIAWFANHLPGFGFALSRSRRSKKIIRLESHPQELSRDTKIISLGLGIEKLSLREWSVFSVHEPVQQYRCRSIDSGQVDRWVSNHLPGFGLPLFPPWPSKNFTCLESPFQELSRDTKAISLGQGIETLSLR